MLKTLPGLVFDKSDAQDVWLANEKLLTSLWGRRKRKKNGENIKPIFLYASSSQRE
jgi:hypothetical protein